MAKTVDMPGNRKPPKWRVRHHNRCKQCGRSRAFLRQFDLCRICFRNPVFDVALVIFCVK